ncbi:putative ABC transport system permease protein [Abditibacterium utsteinense]|uniref:Putative ABC transport system permease protein n=1 Tax=Abditibacterium utsteinense TaxID=1960156 RepID=A0A2S8SR42_9BACT|nr:FtsX-like permease family protein [Abditibacterium utsteinense]PQV63246.1 putative ABC transport system permease protein [Abditibacterium utsteinense]
MTSSSIFPDAAAPATKRHQSGTTKTLPPLSPLTYYRRNIWRVLPVGGAIMISVFLIAAIVTLLNSVDASIQVHYGSMSHFSILSPQYERDVPPAILARAEKFPERKKTLVAMPYFVFVKTVFGDMPVPIYGLEQKDMKSFVGVTGNTLSPGSRFPRLNEPEIALSRAWANNFHLKLGDKFAPKNDRLPPLSEPLTIVGIFENGENIGLTDKAYLQLTLSDVMQRPSYIFLPSSPQKLQSLSQKMKDITDKPQKYGFTKDEVRPLRVFTFNGLVSELRKSLAFLYKFLGIADALVIGAVALLSGFLANIYFEQRLGEFGLLSALGFRRERLAKRLMIETGSLVIFSWVVGLGLTALLFKALDDFYMIPNGLVLAKIGRDAMLYTLPTPLLVGVASLATVLVRLYRLDPIEIMERR